AKIFIAILHEEIGLRTWNEGSWSPALQGSLVLASLRVLQGKVGRSALPRAIQPESLLRAALNGWPCRISRPPPIGASSLQERITSFTWPASLMHTGWLRLTTAASTPRPWGN